MNTAWDYTSLAAHYDKRAEYSDDAVTRMLKKAGVKAGATVADLGAGTGKLTSHLLRHGLVVKAVEPNDEMRKFGMRNTNGGQVTWTEGVAEKTGLPAGSVSLVTFGSSFNVCDRAKALKEAHRILKADGWFACLWNHRDLEDPIQAKVEKLIKDAIPAYAYGTRREDQAAVIEASGLFGKVEKIEGTIVHETSLEDYIEAWKSHATLQRQAGDKFEWVIHSLRRELAGHKTLRIPYMTRIWCAKRK